MKSINCLFNIYALIGLLLLNSCSSDNENVITPLPDEPDPVTKVFTSTDITSLEKEVSAAIGTTYTCHDQIVLDDCYNAGANLLAVITNGYNHPLPNFIKVNLNNNINRKTTIVLNFSNSEAMTKSILNDHRIKFTAVPPPPLPLISDVENDFLNQTLIKLICRVKVAKCIKAADKLITLYDDSKLPNRIDQVVVDNTNPIYSRHSSILIKSNMSVNQIDSLILSYSNSSPSGPVPPRRENFKRVKKEIRDRFDVNLYCIPNVLARNCLNVARNFLEAMHSQNLSRTTIMKVEVTTATRFSNTREILFLNSSYDLKTINKAIKAHTLKYGL